ncbi:glycoside hydrolase family 43 protein [Ceratobasidium sp. AG-Ba]|nr:glycoside hydrolase family 43 protein [Ceratobasidium sp. AG-Ba]
MDFDSGPLKATPLVLTSVLNPQIGHKYEADGLRRSYMACAKKLRSKQMDRINLWSLIAVPGATWLDTDGNVLHAHAGGIVRDQDTWYWFGQNEEKGLPLFSGINVYSSKDLLNWKSEGKALSPISGTEIGPERVVERPKVVYNPPTKTWVMWFHADNSSYGLLRQGVATSPNVTGPYTFQYTLQPLEDFSQDLGMFQDDDGKVYSLYSNGDGAAAHDNKITLLNDNFTLPSKEIYTFYDFDLEAPNILRTPNLYYAIMSHKTGYRPNNVVYFSAQNLSGPWSIQNYITPMGTRTFNSQSTFNIRVNGTKRLSWIYAGDQWATAAELWDSRYMWLPVEVDDRTGSLQIVWHDIYSVDVKTGRFTYPKGQTYEAENGVVTGSAYATRCPTCSGNKIVTGIAGANSTLTIDGIKGSGKPQWVSFYYHNPDGLFGDNRGVSGQSFALSRFATVSVNGAPAVTLRQRDTNSGVIMSQPLNVTFAKGSNNNIVIGGYNGGAASDIDRIIVYDSD